MFTVTVRGFQTQEQAEAFVNWYEGVGEQDIEYWLEEHADIRSLTVDCAKSYPNICAYDDNIDMTVRPE